MLLKPNRPPDLIIGTRENPRTNRWHLWIPRFLKRRGWQLALHQWFRSDDDRALHDHRSWSLTLILTGGYYEVTERGVRWYPPGSFIYRPAAMGHRVLLRDAQAAPIWTLWLRGRHQREWGFHCPKGWRPAREYLAEPDYSKPGSTSTVGRGCD